MKKPFSLIVIFLLCFSMFAVFAPKAHALNSLVSYWKFDEGSGNVAHDSSGISNDGAITGAEWVPGISGSALRFRDSSTYMTAGFPNGIGGNHEFTVSLWVKILTWPSGEDYQVFGYLIYFGHNGEFVEYDTSFHVLLDNDPYGGGGGSPYGTVRANFLFRVVPTVHTFLVGTWYNWAFVYDKISVKMYQNGTFLEDIGLGGATPNLDPDITILSSWGIQYFDGLMDEVAICDYAKTPQEILNDYNSISGGSRSPVAYWKFDEGSGNIASDSAGNGNDGTVNGAQWVDGINGKALRFDGINDYVYIPNSPSLDISGNEISVEYWVNFPRGWYPGIPIGGDYTHGHIVFDKGDAYTACFYDTAGTHVFNIPYVPPYPESNKNTWDANAWYHIADVFDGSQIRMYVNGVLDKAETVIGSVSRSSINLAIGSHCYGGMRFFEGIIDEFKIYNYARTAEEIHTDAQSTVRAWKDDSSLGLENDRLYLHGLSETGNYRWFFDYLVFKDTGTMWYQPWGELAILVYPNFQPNYVSTTDFEVNAFTEADKAYLQYSITSGNLKEELTYTIYPDEPYVNVTLSVTNVGSTTENTYAGVQFTTWIAGDYANDYYYVPGHGQGQFTGGTGNINYPDATETWVAEWDQNKAEGCGILSTKGFSSNNAISEDFGNGEGFKYISPSFDLAPGQTSTAYDNYLYFFTGTGWQKTKDFYDAVSQSGGGQKPIAVLTVDDTVHNIGADVWFYGSHSYDPDGGKITSYIFDFDDQTPNVHVYWPQIGTTHQYSAPGEYWPKMKVIDDEGMESDWTTAKLTILPAPGFPTAILTVYPNPQKMGDPVTFDASQSSDPDGISDYGFEFGDGTSVMWTSNPIVTHSYSQVGEYYARVLVADTTGLETWSTKLKVTISSEAGRPPSKPLNLQAWSDFSGVDLTWNQPTDVGSGQVQCYNIYRWTDGIAKRNIGNLNAPFESPLRYDDSITDDRLYYYEVTACNSAGEGSASEPFKCSRLESIKGIETVLDLNDFKTKGGILGTDAFSVQQNFIIPIGWLASSANLDHFYWAQNVILVIRIGDLGVMFSNCQIWEIDGASSVLVQKSLGPPYMLQDSLIMRSMIEGQTLVMKNNFGALTYANIPQDSWINTVSNTNGILGNKHASPEIEPVGFGYFNFNWEGKPVPISDHVDFDEGTNGHVDSYVCIGNLGGDNWLQGKLSTIPNKDRTVTAEYSTGLRWDDVTGDFECPHESQFIEQGFSFEPNYDGSPILLPSVPSVPQSPITSLTISLNCPATLSLYDSRNRYVGYNSSSRNAEVEIPNTLYIVSTDQELIIVFGSQDTYRLDVTGTGYGAYTLETVWQNETGASSTLLNSSGIISKNEVLSSTIQTDTVEPFAISWEYIFKDAKRGTALKISTDDKYFQFIAPGKDFGVKYDPKMFVKYGIIVICYGDAEMRLTATAVDGDFFHFCTASAYDKQTRKTYTLVDKAYGPRCLRLYEQL